MKLDFWFQSKNLYVKNVFDLCVDSDSIVMVQKCYSIPRLNGFALKVTGRSLVTKPQGSHPYVIR